MSARYARQIDDVLCAGLVLRVAKRTSNNKSWLRRDYSAGNL